MEINEAIDNLISILLETRRLRGSDSFEIVGSELVDNASSRSIIESALIYLDRNDLSKVWVLEDSLISEFDDTAVRKSYRYKNYPNYHLNDEPIEITITEPQVKLIRDSDLSKSYFDPKKFTKIEDNYFYLTVDSGETKEVEFDKDNSGTLKFFQVLYEDWLNNARLAEDWITSEISKKDFVNKLYKQGIEASDFWIKNTKSNLIRTKIKNKGLEKHLEIYFDRNKQCYGLKIHR